MNKGVYNLTAKPYISGIIFCFLPAELIVFLNFGCVSLFSAGEKYITGTNGTSWAPSSGELELACNVLGVFVGRDREYGCHPRLSSKIAFHQLVHKLLYAFFPMLHL